MKTFGAISVVIPTHNRKQLLRRCLDSVLAQRFQPHEILVVDDGSTDSTAEMVKNCYPQVTVHRQNNAGVSKARNAGIDLSTGEWIAFLDSDDVWLPEKLEKQVSALKQNADYRICHTEELWFYEGKRKAVARRYLKQRGWIYEYCLPVCAISPSTVMIHKSVFEEVGGFDEAFTACEDYELWLRIGSRLPVLLVDEPLIEKHAGHPGQLSSQRGLDQWRIRALEKILKSGFLNDDQRKKTIEELKRKCRVHATGLEKYGKPEIAAKYRKLSANW